MAVREGFEPSVELLRSYNGLANRRLQPLGHLTVTKLLMNLRVSLNCSAVDPRTVPNWLRSPHPGGSRTSHYSGQAANRSPSASTNPRFAPSCRTRRSLVRRLSRHLRTVAAAGATWRGTARSLRSSFPEPALAMPHFHHASPRLDRSPRDEFAEPPTSPARARSFQNLGDTDRSSS